MKNSTRKYWSVDCNNIDFEQIFAFCFGPIGVWPFGKAKFCYWSSVLFEYGGRWVDFLSTSVSLGPFPGGYNPYKKLYALCNVLLYGVEIIYISFLLKLSLRNLRPSIY